MHVWERGGAPASLSRLQCVQSSARERVSVVRVRSFVASCVSGRIERGASLVSFSRIFGFFYFRGAMFASWEFERRASLSASGIGYLDTMKCIVEIARYRGFTRKSDVHAKVKESLSLLCLRPTRRDFSKTCTRWACFFPVLLFVCWLIASEKKCPRDRT